MPVYVPSYTWTGDTHLVAVGDEVCWRLSVMDTYFPDHLLAVIDATAEPLGPPTLKSDYYRGGESRLPLSAWCPTLLRQGGLSAWWDPERPVTGKVKLRAWFSMSDTRFDDEEVPETRGTIRQLYSAAVLYRQRDDGPWERLPSIALKEVESTEGMPTPGYKPYLPSEGVDPKDGEWVHVGWVAMIDVMDRPT